MRKALFLLPVVFLCACYGVKKQHVHKVNPADSVPNRIFALSKTPTQEEIKAFQDYAEECFTKAYGRKGSGLKVTYMVSPAGAIAPFSSAEVKCMAGPGTAKSAHESFCTELFDLIEEKYQ